MGGGGIKDSMGGIRDSMGGGGIRDSMGGIRDSMGGIRDSMASEGVLLPGRWDLSFALGLCPSIDACVKDGCAVYHFALSIMLGKRSP